MDANSGDQVHKALIERIQSTRGVHRLLKIPLWSFVWLLFKDQAMLVTVYTQRSCARGQAATVFILPAGK
jgi:hypothetical protein